LNNLFKLNNNLLYKINFTIKSLWIIIHLIWVIKLILMILTIVSIYTQQLVQERIICTRVPNANNYFAKEVIMQIIACTSLCTLTMPQNIYVLCDSEFESHKAIRTHKPCSITHPKTNPTTNSCTSTKWWDPYLKEVTNMVMVGIIHKAFKLEKLISSNILSWNFSISLVRQLAISH
jgi:hypothetical protein